MIDKKTSKKIYPKTYHECCYVVGDTQRDDVVMGYKSIELHKLQKLIRCRDAYWKFAGDWKPDWIQATYTCTIICRSNNIVKDSGFDAENKILAFPTEEMRDVFYENFKELIEECKELL